MGFTANTLYDLIRRLGNPVLHAPQVLAWHDKAIHLSLLINDLPKLADAARAATEAGGKPEVGKVKVFDATPQYRLAMTLEHAAHTLYSLADIAAQVASKASRKGGHQIPATFNGICKAARKGKLPDELAQALGDLSWYGRVHEMRTECTHFSSLFVIAEAPGVTIRTYAERFKDDQKHLPDPALFTLDDFVSWLRKAVETTNGLADFIVRKYAVPAYDLNGTKKVVRIGADGFPVFTPDGRFELDDRPIVDVLRECGIGISTTPTAPGA